MRRMICVLVGGVLLGLLAASNVGCGVGRTSDEVSRDTARCFKYDAYMLTDDLSLFFQTDRPLRTSKMVMP